jgi:hypothetical protein
LTVSGKFEFWTQSEITTEQDQVLETLRKITKILQREKKSKDWKRQEYDDTVQHGKTDALY